MEGGVQSWATMGFWLRCQPLSLCVLPNMRVSLPGLTLHTMIACTSISGLALIRLIN